MDHTYESTTVEMDRTGFRSLQNQLLDSKIEKQPKPEDIRDRNQEDDNRREAPSKKFIFRKGDDSLELDEDYEFEMMADKRPVRMTLRELKDRAAGDIAVKNRMHALAEEKKKVQSTFKEFASLAKTDPLAALEFISNKAKESDSEFEYQKYIEKLSEQAEMLGKMDEKELKAWELEKKLQKAEQDLSHKERQEAVVLRKQEIIADYPEIGDSEFSNMVEAVLGNEELLEGVEDEHGVMDRVEELIQETLTQRDIISVIEDINPDHIHDNQLIFALSDQLRQNPDLDEEDVRDIVRDLIQPEPRVQVRPQRSDERDRDVRILSNKQRQGSGNRNLKEENVTPYQSLEQQLRERKSEFSRTPLNKR